MKLENISKAYGNQRIFENFTLEIETGKILCVLGESGGGKTTLLNILAGLTDFSGTLSGVPDTATTEIYTLSLHDALPICKAKSRVCRGQTRENRGNSRKDGAFGVRG